ncbi:MAG: type I toxin-antitoxin system toxin Ldr family protein [Kluyvera sp.]
MTLMQFAVIFWHDLAAPVIAGVMVSPIVSHWRSWK